MTHVVVVGGVLLSVINLYADSSSIHGDMSSSICEEDHQCHSNEFCFLETHACAPCYNCTSYNRKPSEGKSCSKEPLDCGKCFEGYRADRLTTGKEREYCVKVDQDKELPVDEVMHTKLWIFGIIGGLFVLILIIIIIIALVIRYKRKRKPPRCEEHVENGEDRSSEEKNYERPLLQTTVSTANQENGETFGAHTPSAPPPYESQIVYNLDTRNVRLEKQMATPFLLPGFPYEEAAPSVDSDEVSEHEMPEEVDQDFHDADTDDPWSEEEVEESAVENNVEEIISTPRCSSESEVFENAVASSQTHNDSGISQTSSVVTSTRSLDMTEVDDGGQPSRKRPRNDSGTHSSEINISSDINSQSQE